MKLQKAKKLLTTYKTYDIYAHKIDPPFPVQSELNSVGLDPGTTHIGVAYIWRTIAWAYEVRLLRNPDPVERILVVQYILTDCIKMFDYAPVMTIEGAAFGSNYRNTELAEVRASAVLWALAHGIKPRILSPTMIRKVVFGNGKVKAEDTWKFIPPNAASALACACYPFKV